ncbi:MAG TPA: RagB/SusD family nutrient uptake outer membrane protein [Parafilimonas sp.]|nr:RagB/SusD family nutrient uptake outer membrane protein [Parafilimonas sp.]
MKMNKFKIILSTFLMLVSVLLACNKFLDKSPIGTLSPNVIYNKNGVEGLLIGAYALLDGEGGNNSGWGSAASNWVYGSVCADDAYKGSTPSDQGDIVPLEEWNANSTNPYPAQKWALCYDGVQRANEVLRVIPLASDLTDPTQIAELTGEARFLRGFYHMELKKVFGNVPFISDTIVATTKPESVANVDGSGNYVNIWPQIEDDLKFAVNNIALTQTEVGRVNKWAAMAFLAKAYMFQGKYSDAKGLLDDIIQNGTTSRGVKYKLTDNYYDNFNPATQNNSETVFAAQMSVNDGSGTAQNDGNGVANGNYGDALNFPYNAGPGACCGFFNPSQSLANTFKTDANGLPLIDAYQSGNAVNAHTNPYAGTLDPRIDMVMGRPGVPYLDWGAVPADDSWIRSDQGPNGRFVPKKNVYSKSQQGNLSSTESQFWAAIQLTANRVNLIRYADVLLWAAECEEQIGDPEKARAYVNQVRERAAKSDYWIKNAAGTANADNYKIGDYPAGSFDNKAEGLKKIQFERRLELAMEGHRFFDLVRWGTAQTELNAYAAYEKSIKNCYIFFETRQFTETTELYPIPQAQIDALNANGNTNLKQNPGY